jgi:hypothetical protein
MAKKMLHPKWNWFENIWYAILALVAAIFAGTILSYAWLFVLWWLNE